MPIYVKESESLGVRVGILRVGVGVRVKYPIIKGVRVQVGECTIQLCNPGSIRTPQGITLLHENSMLEQIPPKKAQYFNVFSSHPKTYQPFHIDMMFRTSTSSHPLSPTWRCVRQFGKIALHHAGRHERVNHKVKNMTRNKLSLQLLWLLRNYFSIKNSFFPVYEEIELSSKIIYLLEVDS